MSNFITSVSIRRLGELKERREGTSHPRGGRRRSFEGSVVEEEGEGER